jgi:tetratricopeptide (TPR) repeat protein
MQKQSNVIFISPMKQFVLVVAFSLLCVCFVSVFLSNSVQASQNNIATISKKPLLQINPPLSQADIAQAYAQSFSLENQAKYIEAAKALKQVYQKFQTTYTVNLRLGYLYYLAGQFANSQKHYQQAINAVPSAISPRIGIMNLYQTWGKSDQALSQGQAILKQDPFHYATNLRVASLLLAQQQGEAALTIYKTMLSLYPEDTSYLSAYAQGLWQMGWHQAAQDVAHNILVLEPNNTIAKNLLSYPIQ